MLVEPVTTWLLVRISPVGLMIMPVPAAWPLPRVVSMSTIAGTTLAEIASVVVELPPLPAGEAGVTWVIGCSGWEVDCATPCGELTARARLQPMPAPAATATTATSTTKAAIRFQSVSGAGAGAGGGVHGVGAPGVASAGGSKLPWFSSLFMSDIWIDLTSAWPGISCCGQASARQV